MANPSPWLAMAKKSATLPDPPKAPTKSAPTHVELKDAHRAAARQIISNLDLKSLEAAKTTCLMFYVNNLGELTYSSAVSGLVETTGQESRLKKNREKARIEKKDTICAEEVLLATYHKPDYLFSWAYDTALRREKRACQAGCHALLEQKRIEDLAN